MFIVSNDFYAVSGDEFYVGTTGSNANSCTQISQPCLTLDTPTALRGTVDSSTEYTVFIMDKTTLSMPFTISSTQTLPRTFTNNPQSSSIQSVIEIAHFDGYFEIYGNSLFDHINFTLSNVVSNSHGGIINVNIGEPSRTLEISNCNFIGFKTSTTGGALGLSINNYAHATLKNLLFEGCEANIAGAVFITIAAGGQVTVSESCTFTECKITQNNANGGGIYAIISGQYSKLIFKDSVTFDKCSGLTGSGISLLMYNFGQLTIEDSCSCSFIDCDSTATGGTGTFYIEASGPNYEINLLGEMIFERCNSDEYGGGLFIGASYAGQITINEMSFIDCNSAMYGGGFFSKFESGTQMTISGIITYDKCHCTGRVGSSASYGGGQYIEAGQDCKINVTGELEYKECEAHQGGGLHIEIFNKATVELNKATFTDSKSRLDGGGLFLYVLLEAQFTIYGTASFINCNSSTFGGAIRFRNDGGIINVDPTEQILIENCNSINNGSGIYCSITNKGQTQINYIKFSKCKSLSGGGIFARINLEGQLILSKSYEFDQCESIQDGGGIITTLQSGGQMTVSGPCSFTDCKAISDGTGGGIYATVNGENCQFIFEDSVTFDGCQALYKGGGIYLDIYNGGLFTLSGPSSFTDCTAQNVSGGGCCINAYQPKYEINLQGKMQFERCSSKNGGGLFIDCQFAGQFTIKNISFTGCNCTNQGGALFSYLRYGAKITITGKVEFDDCHNINGFGGGQYLLVIGLASQILITGELVYKQCEAKLGGGLFVSSQNKAIIGINKASFKNCYSQENGGGIYASVETEGQLSFDNSFEFYQCESGYDGGGIYNYLGQGGQMTISGPCLFTECRAISTTFWGYGGGIYAKIEGQNSSFSVEDSMTFDRCQAFICGGGMRLDIGGLSKFSMFGSVSFTDCTAQNAYGGGYYINALDPDYEINLQGKMQFERCRSDEYGGGLFIDCHLAGQITIKDISFTGCNSTSQGGALFSGLSSGVQMTITGKVAFDKCNSNNQGGGQYQELAGLGSLIRITGELEYKECASIFGGGLCIIVEDRSTVEINKASFIDCLSGYAGGGLFLQARTGGQFTITGTASFTDCNSSSVGGGIYLETNNGTVNFNPTEQILIDNCNSLQDGGGIYCWINNQGQVQINNIKFSRCKSLSGGGIYASIQSGGQLILDKSCELYQCKSNGNGGGIYINIDFSTQCSFLIKDAFIHDCKALINNSLSYSQTGFGGGLFLGGSGDYSPISKLIDLHGMNITNNSADKYGQSLFVAMTKIVEFCKYGILGEYVKGNYSDTYSDENDLEGIPMNLTEFNTSTLETIEQKQQPLEPWWRILGILRSAQVIVNVSNPNGKLIFNLEGQSMIPGYLNVKIFELRDKTQEEIDQEQKEMNYIFNNNNFITVKQISYQSKFTQKHQTINQQQISINSNIKIKKKLHNNANEIIYPPEDGSISPISIEGEIPNDQKATFGINDYKWLNYKEKVYGTLISNDRNIFTGKDGHDIEEDENAAVQLEVIIEEEVEDDESEIDDPEKEDDDKKDDSQKEDDPEEQGEKDGKGKGLQVGAIIGIVFGILAFITLIVIIIIIVVKNEKENKQQNNEQQLSDLSTIVEPSKSSASNNQMSQIKTPPLSKVNSQIKSFDITNSQVRSYDITNASDQQSNISNPKVQQTFISNSQVHPNNSTISKAQPSIKPVSKKYQSTIMFYSAASCTIHNISIKKIRILMQRSNDQPNKTAVIGTMIGADVTTIIPRLIQDLESDSINLHTPALRQLLNIIVDYRESKDLAQKYKLMSLLKKFVGNVDKNEEFVLSTTILHVIGVRNGTDEKIILAKSATDSIIHSLFSPDEKISEQGSKTLQKLIEKNKIIRNSLMTTGFIMAAQHAFTNSSQSSSSSQTENIPPYHVKCGLIDIVYCLVTTADDLNPISILIPILNELKNNGEKEIMKKAGNILAILNSQGINATSSNSTKEKDQKIQELELENRYKDEENRRKDEEINKLKDENYKLLRRSDEAELKVQNIEQEKNREKQEKERKEEEIRILKTENHKMKQEIKRHNIKHTQGFPIQIINPDPSNIDFVDVDGVLKRIICKNNKENTISLSQVLENGIWQMEAEFSNAQNVGAIGIVRDSYNIPAGVHPDNKPHCDHIVSYGMSGYANGDRFYYKRVGTRGNIAYNDNQKIKAEYDSEKGTLIFFVEGVLQPIYATGINEKVRFIV
ncbi:MAG: hypothetical protein EZS28_001656 [Streblomastix strix]|uniref:Uncharacterized protein n=1 Tax=Streblomastix strix TaxID=222440 RepID=A0A5J4X7V2_9EUKA|nr:MAG: hypothetical protein EZS28_001656 [Streblomastix strix]